MYWSRKNLILVFLLLFFAGCVSSKNLSVGKKTYENEDRDILFAIEYLNNNDLINAKNKFHELYLKSNNDFYLLRALKLELLSKNFTDIVNVTEEKVDKSFSNYEEIYQLYLISLINLGQNDKALEKSLELIKEYKDAKNYEIIANLYYLQGDYENAAKYFESSYAKSSDKKILLNLVNILYGNLNEKKKAISYLETHLRLYDFDLELGMKLFSFYKEEKNIHGIISILNRSYEELGNTNNEVVKAKIEQLLISYLQVQNIDDSISFLEKNKFDNLLLLDLYKKNEQYDKALALANKIYEEKHDLNIYAQIAMLEFEVAKDKKKVLKSVVLKFEDVLSTLDNAVYQNFLGYILIDYDVDVKKGLSLVKKALEKEPNNLAYIDSLAWGEYKLKNCKIAKEKMKIVIDKIGLDEEEIKSHWEKIKECKK